VALTLSGESGVVRHLSLQRELRFAPLLLHGSLTYNTQPPSENKHSENCEAVEDKCRIMSGKESDWVPSNPAGREQR
jgi:hypothetical protein